MNEINWGAGGPAIGGSAAVLDPLTPDGVSSPAADGSADNAELYIGQGGPLVGGAAEIA